MNPENPFEEKPIDIRAFAAKLKAKWGYFVISLLVCMTLAFLSIHYLKPQYRIGTTLLLRDDKNTSLGAENLIDGLELFAGKKNLENEIGLLRSYQLIHKAIREADFKVSYFTKAYIKSVERYRDMPFKVHVDTTTEQITNVPFFVEVISPQQYLISASADGVELYNYRDNKTNKRYKKGTEIAIHDTVAFGEVYRNFGMTCTLTYNPDAAAVFPEDEEMYFVMNDLNHLTEAYRKELTIQPINSDASILMLQLERSTVDKEIAFLDRLSKVYIDAGLEEKNEIALNTIAFIDSELNLVNDTLQRSELELQDFRTRSDLVDLTLEAQNSLSSLQQLENDFALQSIRLKYFDYLIDYLGANDEADNLIAPSTMGIEDPTLNSLVNELRQLYSDQVVLKQSATVDNPYYTAGQARIMNVRKTILENALSLRESAKLGLDETSRRISRIDNDASGIPQKQRQLISIERRFNLNSAIFTYLMQKRSEAQIAKASNTSDSRVLDAARLLDENPVFPKKIMFYALALVIGLLIPMAIVVLQEMLSDTVKDRSQIENYEIPVLGMTGHNFYKSSLPINDYPRSSIAESIRLIKLNLQYLAPSQSNKIIGVTSTVSGEGKTFCSVNLALSLAKSGQRTLIIGTDMRKPRLHEPFKMTNDIGLSTYLISEATEAQAIRSTVVENLDIITSGPIPPNPFELLSLPRFQELMTSCRSKYDYIIVDSPPIGFVADYFAISEFIDATIFILRFKYSKVRFIEEAVRLKKSARLSNLYVLLNDYRDYSSNQGYYGKSKYSVYYGENGRLGRYGRFKQRLSQVK